MEILKMSQKERNRLAVMGQVKHRKLSLREAAAVMVLSYRQAKRVWRRYQDHGDAGLVHGLRGRPSARRTAPRLRAKILARYQSRYADFGPTLAAEYLRREDRGSVAGAAAAATASAVAGTQSVPGANGAIRRLPSRLV
jgi:hypothetical protein